MDNSSDNNLASDLIWGARAIADEIGLTLRQTQYQLERGLIPAGKQGRMWVASRRRLRGRFEALTAGNVDQGAA